jgi:uncharacterized glyoxalase superfamily protein PhnB
VTTTDLHPPEPPDPFEALRLDDGPIEARSDFVAGLRRHLLTELQGEPAMTTTETATPATTPTTTPTTSTSPPAPRAARVSTVTPYLIVRNGIAALDFYRDAFGAVELQRFVGDDGRVGHSELMFGDTKFALADEHPEYDILGPQSRGGATCSFQLDVDDVDGAFAHALSLGATVAREPADQFHGNRTATVIDPFGHHWTLLAPLATMTEEAYVAAGAAEGYRVVIADGAPSTGSTGSTDAVADPAEDPQLKHYGHGDLYYFTIPVPDLAKAQAFFGAVLGWQFAEPQTGHISNIAAPPGGMRPSVDDAGRPQLYFVVDDIQAAVAKVRELGGTSAEPVLYESGWTADCVDDQGITFSLSVPAAKYSL